MVAQLRYKELANTVQKCRRPVRVAFQKPAGGELAERLLIVPLSLNGPSPANTTEREWLHYHPMGSAVPRNHGNLASVAWVVPLCKQQEETTDTFWRHIRKQQDSVEHLSSTDPSITGLSQGSEHHRALLALFNSFVIMSWRNLSLFTKNSINLFFFMAFLDHATHTSLLTQ